MKRMQIIGLALVAVFAMSAVGVASALTDPPEEFMCESYPCSSDGTNTTAHVFKTNAGTVSCSTATFTDSLSGPSPWVKAQATYTGCTAFGFINANINMKDCEYEFHVTTDLQDEGPDLEHSGTVDVINKAGATKTCAEEPITITVSGTACVVTVGPQTGRSTVTFTNGGSGTSRTVTVASNISGITYTQNASCSGGAGTFTNGTYTGSASVKGDNSKGKQQGIWIN